MNEYYGSLQEFEAFIEESNSTLTNINDLFDNIASIFSGLLVGAYFIFWIILIVGIALVSIFYYIFSSIPVYKLAKRAGYKYAWIAWIPFSHRFCRSFVLCEVVGNKPFVPQIGKFKIESRKISFLAYILIYYFGYLVISSIVALLSIFLPGIGTLSSVLALVPAAACCIIEYVYLRDLLDIYKEDQKSNNVTAIVVTVIDALLLTFPDFVRTCLLYSLLKKQPLPCKEIVIDNPTEYTV